MTDLNVKKALQQHLQSLRWSGLSDLSGGGELEFDLQALAVEPVSQPSSPSPNRPNNTPAPTPSQESSARRSPSTGLVDETKTAAPAESASAAAKTQPVISQPVISQPVISRQGQYGQPIADLTQRQNVLATLAAEVASCQKCPELCRNRSQTVFGSGPADAKIVFLGEGPGANEDAQGEPFVGEAGKLLDRILTASKLPRDQVYILNVVKCRPPANRNPTDAEVQNCWDYLQRQLDVIQPTHIVCLGSVAAKTLLNTKSSLGKLRKRFHQYCGSKVIATYHPAYLLRNQTAKKYVWEDMKMLMTDLGVDL